MMRRTRVLQDLDQELHDHIEQDVQDNIARGMSPDEARRAARRAFGNLTLVKEDARAVWVWRWLESVWQDLRYGIRGMRRQPAFTAVALIALGSTIGLNTSLFTAFNAMALRPLPVSDPARVVNLYRFGEHGLGGVSIAEYRYLAAHAHSFGGVAVTQFGDAASADGQKLTNCYVSGNYFRVLGVPMEIGRGFLDDEDRTGQPVAVVVIAFDTWQARFGGDPHIVGTQIRLGDVPFTVVGVAARNFKGTLGGPTDLWIPVAARTLLRPNDPSVLAFLTAPSYCCSNLTARLAPGVSREQARAETALLLGAFRREVGRDLAADADPVRSANPRVELTGTAWLDDPGRARENAVPILGLMFLAVTLIVLLACANVGNLLLARAAARHHEMGVRLSLGGSRLRLIRQLLVESLTLAAAAAAIGFAIAWVLPTLIVRRMAGSTIFQLTPDWTVLAYTMGLATLASLAFGLAPALHATRGSIAGTLRRGWSWPGGRVSLRGVLLVVQVAISVLLLTCAGMLVRGLQAAQHADPGFTIDGVSAIALDMPASAYGRARTQVLARQLMANLEATPGLPPWALTMDAPLANGQTSTSFHLTGEAQEQPVLVHEVSRGYFEVLRIAILAGRNFTVGDAARQAIVINETMAKRYWPDGQAVGKTAVVNNAPRQIVGVVKDAYTSQLGSIAPTVYFPMDGLFMPQILLRGGGPADVQKIRAVVEGLEPRAQLRTIALSDNLRTQTQSALAGVAIAGGLGLVALTLAAVGMAGVFAYAVRQRAREMSIRIALGAQPRAVVRLVLGSTVRAVAAGLLVGLCLASITARLLAHQFYGVTPLDLTADAGVTLLLGLATLFASAAPARRAARLDPIRALRQD